MIFQQPIADHLAQQDAVPTNRALYIPRIETVSAPAVTAVTLAETKEFLRVDTNAEDTLINGLLGAAINQCQALTGRAFITQTLRAWYDNPPPNQVLDLEHTPLQSVEEIISYNNNDTSATLSSAAYFVDTIGAPPRVALRDGYTWPTDLRRVNAMSVKYIAGYGDADTDVPAGIKEAIKLLVAHYYEGKDAQKLAGRNVTVAQIPDGVYACLMPFVVKPLGE